MPRGKSHAALGFASRGRSARPKRRARSSRGPAAWPDRAGRERRAETRATPRSPTAPPPARRDPLRPGGARPGTDRVDPRGPERGAPIRRQRIVLPRQNGADGLRVPRAACASCCGSSARGCRSRARTAACRASTRVPRWGASPTARKTPPERAPTRQCRRQARHSPASRRPIRRRTRRSAPHHARGCASRHAGDRPPPRLEPSSSVAVLPITRALAAVSVAGAWTWAASRSGLPGPVTAPLMSSRSGAATRSPDGAPAPAGSIRPRGPSGKAPRMSASALGRAPGGAGLGRRRKQACHARRPSGGIGAGVHAIWVKFSRGAAPPFGAAEITLTMQART